MNNGKICVPVCDETADEMIAQIKRAEEFADVIEVRFDCLEKAELEDVHSRLPGTCGPSNRIIDSTKVPIVSTFRPKEQGGHRELSVDERRDFWNSGFETEYCDVEELQFVDDSLNWVWGNRIYSYHDFSGVPSDIQAIFDRLAKTDAEAEIIKIAAQSADVTDGIPIWKLIDHAELYPQIGRPKVIPIAMGEAGKWTRILGLAHGAYLTYGSLESGKETADGQVTARDLIEIYRVKELDQDTKVFGIVGDPVSSSLSPYMQNPAFVAAGTNAVFIPLLVKDLDQFIRRMVRRKTREVELNFGGFSVTMPHKQAIMKHLDGIDPTAQHIGAVNTVKIDGDKLIGYNTDALGFIAPLKAKYGDLKSANIAIGGAGGAARACVHALKEEGANVTVYARDQKKAEAFADEFGVTAGVPHQSFQPGSIDILVNATPLGMKGGDPETTIATAAQLNGIKLVYDLVYNPSETRLLREAKAAGVPAIGGLEMLVAQGAKQFEIWTGREAPVELMRNAVLERINDGS